MKQKPTKKAYELVLDNLDEGYLSDTIYCYADNHNQARYKLLHMVRYDNWKLKYSGKELNYWNIPVRRSPDNDIYWCNGNEVTKSDYDKILKQFDRENELNRILNDESITHYYIRKGGYYYRPDSAGYTEYQINAGIYLRDEAVRAAKSCSDLILVPVNPEEHNAKLYAEIVDLYSRFIIIETHIL